MSEQERVFDAAYVTSDPTSADGSKNQSTSIQPTTQKKENVFTEPIDSKTNLYGTGKPKRIVIKGRIIND
jgi:hypothetical protein